MLDQLDARPVKIKDGRWAVMVAGSPAVGEAVVVTTPEGKRWESIVTEVGETDPATGEVLCLTTRGPSLPDATAEEMAAMAARLQVDLWWHRHREVLQAKQRRRWIQIVVALWLALAWLWWCA